MNMTNKGENVNKAGEFKKTFDKGDILIVDIDAYSPKKELIEPFCIKDYELVLGKNNFLQNFDDKFLHNEIKPSYKFQLKIPKNHPNEKYRNQKLFFEVTLKNYEELTKQKALDTSEGVNKSQEEINDDPLAKAQERILSLFVENEKLIKQNELLKILLEKEKEGPKAVVIPNELKKEVEQYALQKFFEEFVNYYSLYKVTSLSSEMQAELLDDPKLKAFSKGYRMITWQFDEMFKKYNFVELKPIEGEIFDPKYQKVNEQVIDDEFPSNTIINVHSSAYKLHDRILHVALVDTSVRSDDPQAKVLIEKLGDNAYHKTPGKLHTLSEKVAETIAKNNIQ
ncbi:nucleotide exchange factor GrpE [Mycoplasmopsis agalactiae]|nr:nucleotide exchange factor GrpE [Mycoplasmopsis agalactiae]